MKQSTELRKDCASEPAAREAIRSWMFAIKGKYPDAATLAEGAAEHFYGPEQHDEEIADITAYAKEVWDLDTLVVGLPGEGKGGAAAELKARTNGGKPTAVKDKVKATGAGWSGAKSKNKKKAAKGALRKVRFGRGKPLGRYERPKVGQKYLVSEGAGLASGKVGVMVDYNKYRKEVDAEPGRYKPFNRRSEVVLRGDDGEIFTMFKNYLLVPDAETTDEGKAARPELRKTRESQDFAEDPEAEDYRALMRQVPAHANVDVSDVSFDSDAVLSWYQQKIDEMRGDRGILPPEDSGKVQELPWEAAEKFMGGEEFKGQEIPDEFFELLGRAYADMTDGDPEEDDGAPVEYASPASLRKSMQDSFRRSLAQGHGLPQAVLVALEKHADHIPSGEEQKAAARATLWAEEFAREQLAKADGARHARSGGVGRGKTGRPPANFGDDVKQFDEWLVNFADFLEDQEKDKITATDIVAEYMDDWARQEPEGPGALSQSQYSKLVDQAHAWLEGQKAQLRNKAAPAPLRKAAEPASDEFDGTPVEEVVLWMEEHAAEIYGELTQEEVDEGDDGIDLLVTRATENFGLEPIYHEIEDRLLDLAQGVMDEYFHGKLSGQDPEGKDKPHLLPHSPRPNMGPEMRNAAPARLRKKVPDELKENEAPKGRPARKDSAGREAKNGDSVFTVYCAKAGTPRGEYDEELDLFFPDHTRETAIRRRAQEVLDKDYEPGLKIKRIKRSGLAAAASASMRKREIETITCKACGLGQVKLADPVTNDCPKCGAQFNGAGQELNPGGPRSEKDDYRRENPEDGREAANMDTRRIRTFDRKAAPAPVRKVGPKFDKPPLSGPKPNFEEDDYNDDDQFPYRQDARDEVNRLFTSGEYPMDTDGFVNLVIRNLERKWQLEEHDIQDAASIARGAYEHASKAAPARLRKTSHNQGWDTNLFQEPAQRVASVDVSKVVAEALAPQAELMKQQALALEEMTKRVQELEAQPMPGGPGLRPALSMARGAPVTKTPEALQKAISDLEEEVVRIGGLAITEPNPATKQGYIEREAALKDKLGKLLSDNGLSK